MLESDADLAAYFATFGGLAAYTPPAGGAAATPIAPATKPTVILERAGQASPSAPAATKEIARDRLLIRVAELALPKIGGIFAVADTGEKFRVERAAPAEDRRLWHVELARA